MGIESIGYDTTNYCGVELKSIEYGIDDYAIILHGSQTSNPTLHRIKVKYTSRDIYYTINGKRYSFSNMMRIKF